MTVEHIDLGSDLVPVEVGGVPFHTDDSTKENVARLFNPIPRPSGSVMGATWRSMPARAMP